MYALRTLHTPGTIVAGYQPGDPIDDAVVDAWGLVVGEDVSPDRPGGEQTAPAMARPADDTDRSAWVAYAVSRGSDPDDVADLSIDELADLHPDEQRQAQDNRPADSAKKADWVLYVNDHPQATAEDQAWAGNDTTTKADLMAWQPQAGDTLAVAATEATNR